MRDRLRGASAGGIVAERIGRVSVAPLRRMAAWLPCWPYQTPALRESVLSVDSALAGKGRPLHPLLRRRGTAGDLPPAAVLGACQPRCMARARGLGSFRALARAARVDRII